MSILHLLNEELPKACIEAAIHNPFNIAFGLTQRQDIPEFLFIQIRCKNLGDINYCEQQQPCFCSCKGKIVIIDRNDVLLKIDNILFPYYTKPNLM